MHLPVLSVLVVFGIVEEIDGQMSEYLFSQLFELILNQRQMGEEEFVETSLLNKIQILAKFKNKRLSVKLKQRILTRLMALLKWRLLSVSSVKEYCLLGDMKSSEAVTLDLVSSERTKDRMKKKRMSWARKKRDEAMENERTDL
jgi:hypothetical protein